jgi:hypothetical protein
VKKKLVRIHRAIAEINNPYPPDSSIINYRDFLKHRESLPFYKFNPNVFENLLDLSLSSWHTTERISRLSLLENIRRYSRDEESRSAYLNSNRKLTSLPPGVKKKLFLLFKNCFEEARVLTEKQLPEAGKICNSLLLNIALDEDEEKWLCTNYTLSPLILNRLLRYPKRSKIISSWVKEHYHDDTLRSRRAELLSWILDEEPEYSLNEKTLLDDFNYFNEQDRKAVQEVKETFELNRLLAEQLGNNEISDRIFDIPGIDLNPESDLNLKSLELSKRFYNVPTKFSDDYCENFPDLDKLDVHFHQNLDTFLRVTMMWGIGYSRLNDEQKSALLMIYYSEEAENTFFRICQRCKLVDPLEWLKKNN